MRKTYTEILVTILFFLITGSSWAQNRLQVRGVVYDDAGSPIENVSIYLLSAKTKAIIKTTLTDESGVYNLTNVPKGEFVIQASSIGYAPYVTNAFVINDVSLTMEAFKLVVEASIINEVTVEGKVPLVQQRDGKLVLNVENSTLSAGNNALDILQRAPGVSVDKDENVLLMGQQGANVTIDGRQTYMSGDQLASFLKAMDGSQIKSVEVGTGRTAKDDAEGSIGTINIVLKKNRLEGVNGTFLASAAQGKHTRGNTSLNVNYKKNNTSFFGMYGFTADKRQYDLNINRIVKSDVVNRVFDQKTDMIDNDKTHNYRMGVEHKTSERNTVFMQFSGMRYDEKSKSNSLTQIGPDGVKVDSVLHTATQTDEPFNRYSLNFNNEFKIDSNGKKLTFDADWTAFRNKNSMNFDYRTTDPSGILLYEPELERSSMPLKIDIYVAKLDYVQPIGKGKMEAGLKYSYVKSDNNLGFEHYVNGSWQEYAGRSNYFVYTEKVSAAYVDYSRELGKWSLKLGVRGEHTDSDGNSITLGRREKTDYFKLFPSANVGYVASENHVFSLSYTKKVSRPNYRFLNPFEYFIDKFTSQRGNPYLKPQYTDGFAMNYTLYKMFNLSVGADFTKDAMVESLGQDSESGKTWITRDNLGKSSTSYLNVNAPAQIGKVWTMNNNLTLVYMHFKGPIAGSYLNDGQAFFQGRSTNNFRLSKSLSAELSANYNSAFVYNVYKIHARWGLDLGFNYNFKDQKSSLKLAGTDLFRTQKNNISTNFGEFDSLIKQYNDNRTVRLTFTYKFGSLKQQFRRVNTDSEEKSRAQ